MGEAEIHRVAPGLTGWIRGKFGWSLRNSADLGELGVWVTWAELGEVGWNQVKLGGSRWKYKAELRGTKCGLGRSHGGRARYMARCTANRLNKHNPPAQGGRNVCARVLARYRQLPHKESHNAHVYRAMLMCTMPCLCVPCTALF
eukprot:354635-Chlamydomonas_euryale.AAC.9